MKINYISNSNYNQTNFNGVIRKDNSPYEKEMSKVFLSYIKKEQKIDSMFEQGRITLLEKLKRKSELLNWRTNKENIIKKKFLKLFQSKNWIV